jgi:hypothetical protein
MSKSELKRKLELSKKTPLNDDSMLSKNHKMRIGYRKRIQEDKEQELELKEYLLENGTTIRVR